MSPHKDIKFPPLTQSQQQQRQTVDHITIHSGERERDGAVMVQPPEERKLLLAGSYIYTGFGRKPILLMHLESYVKKELHTISRMEPKYQELRLQVYRDVFGCFIKEFKTYQPILSAIKREYENTLAYQQDQIRELEPLRFHLRRVREECERKIQARWGEEQAEIEALKREKQQLHKDIETMREKENVKQAVVERMQRELSNQYLQYREEHDARQLLTVQLSDLSRASAKEEPPAEDTKDPVELQLALKVCREDLTRAQEELNTMKAEYRDVVPRRNWDTLELTYKQTLLQLKTLQGDFNHLRGEYDTMLELYQKGNMQVETLDSTTVQSDNLPSIGQEVLLPAESGVAASPPPPPQSEENLESFHISDSI